MYFDIDFLDKLISESKSENSFDDNNNSMMSESDKNSNNIELDFPKFSERQ